MRYEILVRALADIMVSLSLANDEDLNPDTAVKLLESAATTLAELDSEERLQIQRVVEAMSDEEATSGAAKRAESLRRFTADLFTSDFA